MLTVKRTLPVLMTIIAGCLWQRPAVAQDTTFYLDRAQISGAPDDGYMVWRPYLYPKTRFYGMLTLGYSHNPLHAGAATYDTNVAQTIQDPVQGQFISYLNVGTQVAGWFGFNISQPISLYTMYGEKPANAAQVPHMPRFTTGDRMGLHDTRFDLRAKYYTSSDKMSRLGLGVAIFIPTGNSAGAVAGDVATTGYMYLSGEHNFGGWMLAGNIGPHFRPQRGLIDAQAPTTKNTLATGSELRWAFGAYVPLREDRYMVGLEIWGTMGLGIQNDINTNFNAQNIDLEWLLLGKAKLDDAGHWSAMGGAGTRTNNGYGAPDFRVLASIGYWFGLSDKAPETKAHRYEFTKPELEADRDGDGYPDSIDKCPDIKEDHKPPNPTDGCPADSDRDHDGIPDSVDACPDVPEDKDGIADQDGCPETDADSDGIPDGKDKCPMEPGLENKLAEKNGCPSLTRFTDNGEIQLLEPIQFDTGKATIKPVSFPILDEVVALMKARKDLKIGVYGHTDSVGNDAMNLTLSKNRAASCMKYLIEHGITASRLQSEGFGETKPIQSNDSAEGRAKNRRTEFKVIQ